MTSCSASSAAEEIPGYFINHSCPSLWFRDAFTLEARRLVLPGDELTFDYAVFEADDSFRAAWTCQCGAAAGRCTGDEGTQSRWPGIT